MFFEGRSSGILCHLTSLPGPHGVGDIGPAARCFADFLADTGQSLWQILPLGPTGYGNSPYMCFSAFGGNPLLVSLEDLAAEGLLEARDLASPPAFPAERVDYPAVHRFKLELLARAHDRFESESRGGYPREYYDFCEHNSFWLEDYALFRAIKQAHREVSWCDWEPAAARHDPDALVVWRNRAAGSIRFHKFVQWVFFRQWQSLREYGRRRQIRIVGDIPMYVAYDSAEVWASRRLFQLDDGGRPTVVAGVPPDYFSSSGQRWGNPIYRWEAMAGEDYRWWIDRFRMEFAKCDILRIDHFRGFEGYWEIPAGDETAAGGRWVKGPGARLFETVRAALDDLGVPLRIIAEDLGVITPEVEQLRDRFGFPGMRILQMAFGNDPKAGEYRPHNHIPNCVVYTSTHDHNTTVGWYTAEPGSQTTQPAEEIASERHYARRYCHSNGREINWDFLRLASGSVARTAVIPLQDVLGLGTEARMNRPGAAGGNWEWRFANGALTDDVCRRLRDLTELYERTPGPREPGAGEAGGGRPVPVVTGAGQR
jgi:4-alpha-glucanotransferase